MKNTIETLKTLIETKTEELNKLKAQSKELSSKQESIELDPEDFTDRYDDMLDECYGEFMNISASRILKELDEIAYNCGLNDFVDGLEVSEESEEYQELEEEIEELDCEIEDLEEEIEELEEELEELED